jgi:hypothetical protein
MFLDHVTALIAALLQILTDLLLPPMRTRQCNTLPAAGLVPWSKPSPLTGGGERRSKAMDRAKKERRNRAQSG